MRALCNSASPVPTTGLQAGPVENGATALHSERRGCYAVAHAPHCASARRRQRCRLLPGGAAVTWPPHSRLPALQELPPLPERLDATHRQSAAAMRAQLVEHQSTPQAFRAALTSVPTTERDAWLDLVLGFDDPLPPDGPELPSGCVPYVPCPVDTLLRLVDQAGIGPSDVFVDVGAGLGRAAALVHLVTGATAIGLEIQPALVSAAREFAMRLNVSRLAVVEGDASRLAGLMVVGTVFFLYCPFSGERLAQVLADLEPLARARPLRVGCVDVPLPPCPWLELVAPAAGDLAVYRSTL